MTDRNDNQASYPRADLPLDPGIVGRREFLILAGLDPDVERSKSWWRSLIRNRSLPPADGPDVDGRPTWQKRTVLWWLQPRVRRQEDNLRYLSPEDDRTATLLAEAHPEAYQAFLAAEAHGHGIAAPHVARSSAQRVPAGSRHRMGG